MKKKKDIETKSKYTKNTFYTQVIMTIIAAVFLVPVFVIINYSFKTKKNYIWKVHYLCPTHLISIIILKHSIS